MSLQEREYRPESTNQDDRTAGRNTQGEQIRAERTTPPKTSYFWIGLGLTVIIGIIAMFLGPLPGLVIMGNLTVALLLGLLWRATLGVPKSYTQGVKFSAQKLLRYGIILTGVRLNFALIASSGIKVLVLDVILILFGVLVLPRLAHKLGLSRGLSFMMGVGQAICGASAVGAIAALLTKKDEEEVSLAVAICGLVGTIGVLLFTFGQHFLALPWNIYGLLSGSTLHEIAQVVAAGPAGGPAAADLAMVVKLTRVVLLAPVALIVAFVLAGRAEKEAGGHFDLKKVPIPWFVVGFLLVGIANSVGIFPKEVVGFLLQSGTFLMVVAMAAMGLQVDIKMIRSTGLKAFGIGVLQFVLFLALSSVLVAFLEHIG